MRLNLKTEIEEYTNSEYDSFVCRNCGECCYETERSNNEECQFCELCEAEWECVPDTRTIMQHAWKLIRGWWKPVSCR